MAFRLTLRLFFSCDDFRFKEIECIWNKKIVTDIRLLSSAAVTASFAEIKTAPVHGSLKQELCMHYQHGQSFFKSYIHTTQCSAPEKEKCLFFKYERKHIFEIFDSFLSQYTFQRILETSAAEEPSSGATTTAQLVCSIVGTTFLLNKSWLAREIFLWRRP